jgi:hypothetical protein
LTRGERGERGDQKSWGNGEDSPASVPERAPFAWGTAKDSPQTTPQATPPGPRPTPLSREPSAARVSPLDFERQDGGEKKWFYLDPQSNVQGPFCSEVSVSCKALCSL